MSDLILQLALFLSLGAIIFTFAKKAPELGEGEGGAPPGAFLSRLPIHKYDARFASFAEKNLRRLRVVLLKVDNGVIGYLERIKSIANKGSYPNGTLRGLFNPEPGHQEFSEDKKSSQEV